MTNKNELGAQIGMSVDAGGVKAGTDEVNKSLASIGSTAEYVGKKTDASLGKVGTVAEKSAKQIAAATRGIAAQADRALASFESGGSISKQLEVNAQRSGASLDKLADKIDRVAAAERKAKAAAVLSQINAVASGVNDDGTARSRAELLALKAAEAGVGKEAEAALRKIALLDAGTGQLGKSAFASRNRLLTLQYTISDVIASAGSGISPLTILLQQGGQVFDAFGGANAREGTGFFKNFFGSIAAILTPARLAIGATATAVIGLGVAMYKGAQQSKEFADAVLLSGNFSGQTEGAFNSLADRISATGKINIAAAREAAQAVIATGEIGPENFARATEAVALYAKATGKASTEVAADFAALSRDVSAGASRMNQSLNFLTTSQVQQIRSLQDQGKESQAVAVVLDALAGRIKKTEENLTTLDKILIGVTGDWKLLGNAIVGAFRADTIDDDIAKIQSRLEVARAKLLAPPTVGKKQFLIDASAEVDSIKGEERSAFRKKEIQEGAAAATAAISALDKRAIAASNYYREAEKGAKLQVARTRELAEEERNYQALVARKITDPGVSLPGAETRAAIQKKIRDSYTDKSGTSDADNQRKAILAQDLAALKDKLSQEQAALQFNQQFLQGAYQASLVSLETYYAERKQLTADGVQAELDVLAQTQARLQQELTRGNFKDPASRTAAETQLAEARAQAAKLAVKAGFDLRLSDQEQAAAKKQLNDRVIEYRASLLQLSGDEEQAAKIRTDLAIANARLFATTAGGQITGEQIANQERLLTIAYKLNEVQRQTSQLGAAAASAEDAYALKAIQTGQSLYDTERGVYDIRAKAVTQLAELARLAKELADNSQKPEDLQRAADLALTLAKALETVDPALNRLRDSVRGVADSISNDIAGSINDFKGLPALIDSIGKDLVRAGTNLLITQPLKVGLEGILKGLTEGDNTIGSFFKGALGIQGGAGLTSQTAAVASSTTALISFTQALASASIALGGQSAGGAAGGGIFGWLSGLFGGRGASNIPAETVSSWAFHSGGIVGLAGSPRAANASMFAGAKRYHQGGMAGLRPGEVPAVLMGGGRGRREEVLTASDPRHSDNGGRAGMSYAPTFHFAGNVDRRSAAQVEAAAYAGAQRAWARNT